MSLVIDDVNILTNISFDFMRTQGMMLEFGNANAESFTEKFDDVSFNSFYKETIRGKAHRIDGSPAECVVIRNYVTHENVISMIPDSSGNWEHTLPVGKYDISYFSEGCAPICHGPYFINRKLTPPAYSSLGGERMYLIRMEGTPNWYSDYYGHSSTLSGSVYQNDVFFKSGSSSLKTERCDSFLTTDLMTFNQNDFVFEGFILFPENTIPPENNRRPFIECNYSGVQNGARGFILSLYKSTLETLSFELLSSSQVTMIEIGPEAINQWIYFAVQRVDGVIRLFIKTEIGDDGTWSEPISGNDAVQNWTTTYPSRIGGGYASNISNVVAYVDSIRITRGSHYGTDENPWPILDGMDLMNFI
jgi:hypothetical protein